MKRLFAILFTLLLCLSFAACTGGGKPENTAAPTEAAEATADPNFRYPTYREVFDPDTDVDNDLWKDNSNIINTEDAYYYAGMCGNYLYYYDKSTGLTDVLCAKPECMHDNVMYNEDCDGCIHLFGGETIDMYEGKIYYEYCKEPAMILYRMDPDGTGKEKLFDFEYSYQYDPLRWGIHRGKLYGMSWAGTVQNAQPVFTWNITCWDIETGEWKIIYEEYTDARPAMFFFDKYVYFGALYTESWYDGDPKDEDTELVYGDTNVKIFRYDIETEQLETLVDVTGPDYPVGKLSMFVASEDRIYVASGWFSGEIPVYVVSDGDLKPLFTVESYGRLSMFEDRIVLSGFELPLDPDLTKRRVHIVMMDYEGNTLYDEKTTLDAMFEASDSITDVTMFGTYLIDGSVFLQFGVDIETESESESDLKSCLVKYEFVNGELRQTLIAVANWD